MTMLKPMFDTRTCPDCNGSGRGCSCPDGYQCIGCPTCGECGWIPHTSREVDDMTVTILHKQDNPFVPMVANDRFKVAYTYSREGHEADLDAIFRENNTVTGDEINVLRGHRSLSVGDVISTQGKFWTVEPTGFKQVHFVPRLV